MPRDAHGQGKTTPEKQEHYRALLSVMLEITPHIWKRNASWCEQVFYEIELNAGSGQAKDGALGSPLIFLDEAVDRQLPFRQFCVEQVHERAQELSLLTSGFVECAADGSACTVFAEDSATAIDKIVDRMRWGKAKFGLLYADPDNHEPPMGAICRFYQCSQARQLDCAINVPATAYKRVRGYRRNHGNPDLPWLSADIDAIPKKVKLIREPIGQYQWTMIVGTNWPNFPVLKKYGFHPIDSPAGQDIYRRVNFIEGEKDDRATSCAS